MASVSPSGAYEPGLGPGPSPSLGARFAALVPSRVGDRIFKSTTMLFALGIAGLVVVIIISTAQNSTLSIAKFGWSFLTNTNWDPVHEQFGAAAFIYGTVVSSILALVFAVPISIGIAVFLVEQAPRRLSHPTSFLVQLLAAIPSVVYGMWGILVLAPLLRTYIYPPIQSAFGFLPLFQGHPNGLGLMTAGLILAVMIVPIVTAVSTDVLRAVPNSQREAAFAMGATKWEATRIVLGAARSGISGAIILGLGRAIGETMAVTMVIGNRAEISARLFDPSYTISAAIANEFTEATSELYRHSLVELGLILFLITFIINVLARLLVWSVTRGAGRADGRA
jgi:phosphate transport system permease protein